MSSSRIQTTASRTASAANRSVSARDTQAQFEAAFQANANKDGAGDWQDLSKSEFQGAITEALGKPIAPEYASQLFEATDTVIGNGDGKVSIDEFGKLARLMSLLEEGQKAVPGSASGSGSEALVAEKSATDPLPKMRNPNIISLNDMWDALIVEGDMDGDGQLDVSELKALREKLKARTSEEGRAAIDRMFDRIELAVGKDGRLNKDELAGVDGAVDALPGLMSKLRSETLLQTPAQIDARAPRGGTMPASINSGLIDALSSFSGGSLPRESFSS